MSIQRIRGKYVTLSVVAAIAAPAGALVLRYLEAQATTGPWYFVRTDITENPMLYLYLLASPLALLLILAWLAGTHSDRNSTLTRRLESMAMRDPVTGLFNRRYMDLRVVAEISRARLVKRPLTCLLVKIAGFERMTASASEAALEPLLCDISFLLRTICREFDIVGHYDRHIFLLVLPETGLYESWIVTERILEGIAGKRLTIGEIPLEVYLNIGGAELDDQVQWIHQLLPAAEDALHQAATDTANQVILHQPSHLRPPHHGGSSAAAHA